MYTYMFSNSSNYSLQLFLNQFLKSFIFDHIYHVPHNSSPIYIIPYPPNFVPFFLVLQNQFVLATQSQTCGLLVNNVLLTRGYSSRENQPFLPQQLTIVSSSTSRGGILCPTPLSLLLFGLTWAYTDFVYTAIATGNLYVQLQLSCCDQKKIMFLQNGLRTCLTSQKEIALNPTLSSPNLQVQA